MKEHYRERDFDRLMAEMFDEPGPSEIKLTLDDVRTLKTRVPFPKRKNRVLPGYADPAKKDQEENV